MIMFLPMRRLLLILGILLAMCSTNLAQMRYGSMHDHNGYAIGVNVGGNMPGMYYMNNEALQRLPQNTYVTPRAGLFLEIPLGGFMALSPEVAYVERGTDMNYEHFSGSQVHYSLKASYADFRLPLELRWPIASYFQPYLMAGAEGGMRLFGNIHIDRTGLIALDTTIHVGDANLAMFHVGAFVGVGIRSRLELGNTSIVVKLSASYHEGLVDSYSPKEREGGAVSVNVNAYQITGFRFPKGMEFCVGIAIPLERRIDNACSNFENSGYHRRQSKGRILGN